MNPKSMLILLAVVSSACSAKQLNNNMFLMQSTTCNLFGVIKIASNLAANFVT